MPGLTYSLHSHYTKEKIKSLGKECFAQYLHNSVLIKVKKPLWKGLGGQLPRELPGMHCKPGLFFAVWAACTRQSGYF
jgi:hypothetical protein